MSSTTFQRDGTHSSGVPQKWSLKDYKSAFESNPLFPYIGEGPGSIIQVNKDFLKEQGDKITFHLRALLAGDGQTDDADYSSTNDEAMVFYNMDVQLHERGHSTSLTGSMTEQSAYKKLRPDCQEAMREWYGMVDCADIIAALSGLTTKNHIAGRITGANAVNAADSQIAVVNQTSVTKGKTATRWFGGGQTTAGVVTRVATDSELNSTSNYLFGSSVIETVHRMARKTVDSSGNQVTPIRPIMVGGEPYYLMLIDLLASKALRNDTKWQNAALHAAPRGLQDHWLFNGMDGIYDGVVIKSTDWLHRRTGANGITAPEYFDSTSDPCANGFTVARNLFLGAQACCLAMGKMPEWKSGYSNPPYNTKYTVFCNFIKGVKASVFNSVPFGSIIVDTNVIAD